MSWMLYEEGKTLRTRGSENGRILRDDEHTEGARITLEQACDHASYAITCGMYGWFFHTRYLGSSDSAEAEYALMKADLSRILQSIPSMEDPDRENNMQEVSEAIAAFVDRYP